MNRYLYRNYGTYLTIFTLYYYYYILFLYDPYVYLTVWLLIFLLISYLFRIGA